MFQIQATISTVQPVVPDCPSVSYDYDQIEFIKSNAVSVKVDKISQFSLIIRYTEYLRKSK